MADISDSEIFDSITTGNGKIEQDPTPAPAISDTSTQPAPNRDDNGRFAANPVEPEAPAQPNVEATPQPETHAENKGGVPVGAVQAEREKRQAAQHEAETLRRELAELRGMVMARQQPAAQPQQPTAPASIWDDPDTYLASQINPVQQELQQTREMLMEMQASQTHGAEVVAAAKEAAKSLFGTPEGKAIAAKGGNIFDNVVQWHKQQQAYARVGSDPDAWLNSEIEKRLSDPTFLAQAVERARGGAQAAVSRTNPVTNVPPSLSRIPAGGNQPGNGAPENDDSLFASVTSSRKRR